MPEAQVTVLAALVGSAVALVGNGIGYAIRRHHIRVDVAEAARRTHYHRLLTISANLGYELQSLQLTGQIYSRWFTGGRILARQLPPPPGPLEIGDRLGRYHGALFDVWSELWLTCEQDEVDHINGFMDEISEITIIALSNDNVQEAHRRLARARRDLAEFARAKLDEQAVRLFVDGAD